MMGNCNWSYRSDGTRVQRGGGRSGNSVSYELDTYVSRVENPYLSYGIRDVIATEKAMKSYISGVLADPKNTLTEKQLVDIYSSHRLMVTVQRPRYYGASPKQVRYADNLAEAYISQTLVKIHQNIEKTGYDEIVNKLSKKYGFKPSVNGYAEYMLTHSSKLKAIQNTTKASDVINTLKGVVDPSMGVSKTIKKYEGQYLGFRLKKGDWDYK